MEENILREMIDQHMKKDEPRRHDFDQTKIDQDRIVILIIDKIQRRRCTLMGQEKRKAKYS
jgi:hypothetical protein